VTVNDVRAGFPQIAAFDLPSTLLAPPDVAAGPDAFCLLALLHQADDPYANSQTNVDALTLAERKAVLKVIRVASPAPQ
jgi:hypothetical protein